MDFTALAAGPPPGVPDPLPLLPVFNALPGAHLLLSPGFSVLAASEAYLQATGLARPLLVGRAVFDVLPESHAPAAIYALRASLAQALATGQPQQMATQRYDVPNPAQPGQLVERYWECTNTPVLDAQGAVVAVVHHVVDATAQVQAAYHAAPPTGPGNQWQARLLAEAPIPMAACTGPEHRFELLNLQMQQLLWERPLLGQPARAALPELAGTPFHELFDQAYRTGETCYGNEIAVPLGPAGAHPSAVRYFNFVYQAVCDAQGAINGVLLFGHEVTMQVRARQQTECLLDSMAQLTWMSDSQGNTTYLNQTWYDYTGMPKQGPIRGVVPTYLHPDDRPRQLAAWYQEALAGAAFELEIRIRRGHDGAYRWHLNRVVPLYGEGQQVLYWVGTATDIHAQKTAQQALQQLNHVLEARVQMRTYELESARTEADDHRTHLYELLMQAPALIALLQGPKLVFQLVNDQMQQWIGPRLLLGRPMRAALPELEGQGFFELHEEVYRTGQPQYGSEVAAQIDRHGTGVFETGYFNFAYQATHDAQGAVDGVLVFGYEVTTEVLARQQAEASQQQQQALNAALSVANEEIRHANLALTQTQAKLRRLNHELESRVAARTEELQLAQATAEAQHQQLYRVLMHVPAAVGVYEGPEHIIRFVNSVYQHLFGSRHLVGRSVRQALPELADQSFSDLIEHVYHTGEPFQGQMRVHLNLAGSSSPSERYINVMYQPLRDAHDRVEAVLDFSYDMTPQVLANQDLERLNQELRLARADADAHRRYLLDVFEQAPVAIAIFQGPHYVIGLANTAVCAIWGRTPAQVLGRPLFEALPEASGQGFEELLDRVMTTGVPYVAHELPALLDRDGQRDTVYFDFVYEPLRNAAGVITGITVVATDMSEQVRAREKTAQANAELRTMIATVPIFIFRLGTTGQVTYLNDTFFDWTGLSNQVLLADAGWPWVHPEDAAALIEAFKAALRAAQPWESTVYRIQRRDGQYRWAITRMQPYFEASGELAGYSGVMVEIHDQYELQRQLTRANVDLDNFIYTASHDLKAPIINIEGLLHALVQELPSASRADGEVQAILDRMQDSVERFNKTLQHLTDLTRLQKEHAPAATAVDLAAVVRDVRLDLAPLIAATAATIDVALDDCPTISFSAKNLRSVVYNLLSNALKYRNPARPVHVCVRCQQADDYTVLTVQDNGLGLTSSNRAQLFTMFQRLHTHVEGSGIGLYMIKKMVENAGGRIEVQSEAGVGSTFAVWFPR